MRLFFILFLAAVITVKAQTPEVPHKMQFAGMTLTIRDDARREIQKDVNALTQSPRHHNIKIERAKTYFPLIEKVFEEERVPDDFKYLALQESALIADAVSVSNAVGFWQFKDFTAVEMGLRVDKDIDERLNIVSSSRAAARYIKKNNFYFNNWIFALQAYQMGAGGAMKAVPKNLSGAKHMEITSSTYWYVKKYLAHKIAFEGAVEGEGQIKAVPYENNGKRHLADIAKEVAVSEDELKQYNKWAKKGNIPDDRTYTVIIPVAGDAQTVKLPETAIASTKKMDTPPEQKAEPMLADRTKINGIKAIKARAGESAATLASRAGVKIGELLMWNEIDAATPIDADQYYLLGKKRSRGPKAYHTVTATDNLWKVSQQYGVKLKKLQRYNRLQTGEALTPGMTLWLTSKKPKGFDKETNSEQIIEVDNTKTFAWTEETMPPESGGEAIKEPVTKSSAIVLPAPDAPTVIEESDQKPLDSAQTLQPVPVTVTTMVDSSEQKAETAAVKEVKIKEHVVQAKETLYGIAHTYNVAVMDLVHWNNLKIQDGIRPGQVIKLEVPESPVIVAAVKAIEHEVRTTDTLYSIARKYGVTIKELMEWNNKKDFSLAIGEKLTIKGK
jgi:membrane-bound lytic murein transglycosylase D